MAGLAPFMGEFKFAMDRGPKTQPVLTLQGCFKLLMQLPGHHAKLFRAEVAHVLLGFFAGDEQLVAEVRANAENTGLLNELAREEMREMRAAAGGAAAAPQPTGAVDDVAQRKLARAAKMQELALRRAETRLQLEEASKRTAAEILQKNMLADAARTNKEKDTATEVAAQNKLAATVRDNEDRASASKRRRLDDDALAARRIVDAEIALIRAKGETEAAALRAKADAELEVQRADVGGSVAKLTASLRDAGQSPEIIATAVAALLARLGATNAPPPPAPAVAVEVPVAAAAAPVQPLLVERPAGYFTVREFMTDAVQTPLFLEVRAPAREQFLRDLGKRLVAECKYQHVDFRKGVKVPSDIFPVTVYAPGAATYARTIAESIVRCIQTGGAQRDIRGAWGA